MLNNFFRIALPYGIRGNNTKGWFAFNREYKPIGFNDEYTRFIYEDYPIYTKYKLTNKKIRDLSANPDSLIEEGDELLIILYNDSTNPTNSKKVKDWNEYFKRLKILSTLKRSDTI